MKLLEAIFSRRTIHRYEAMELGPDRVMKLLEAAHHAPCHKHTWPWRFSVLGPATRAALIDLAIELKDAKAPLSESQRENLRTKLAGPAVFVAVSHVIDSDPFRRREDFAATCCAIQNLLLAAHADGLGAKWSTGQFTRHPKTYDLLDLEPAEEDIVGFIFLGRAATVPDIVRSELAEHVRRYP